MIDAAIDGAIGVVDRALLVACSRPRLLAAAITPWWITTRTTAVVVSAVTTAHLPRR